MIKFLRALLELLRLPNLFTVPGDILLGWYCVSIHGDFPWFGIGASLCLYSAGLLFNDFFDAKVDTLERPMRPIPSGRISRRSVGILASLLMLLGILLAGKAWPVALVLAALILVYDGGLKKIPFVGILTMGSCRGANILLGSACASGWTLTAFVKFSDYWLLPAYFTLYIFLVSLIARREAEANARPRLLPLIALNVLLFLPTLPLFLMLPAYPPLQFCALFCTYGVLFILLKCLLRPNTPLPRIIAGYIRFLIPLQFICCILNPFVTHPTFLYITFPLLWIGAEVTGRRFSGS